jgi:hypothetical protein
MNANHSLHLRLSDLPLWRLLVALDDAERVAGPDSPTARALARAIQERLRRSPDEAPSRKESEAPRCS